MKTRAFGTTDIEVSEIGLGAWQLVKSSQWPDGPDEAEAVRLVHAALAAGVTFIDTAPGYAEGRSEAVLGVALADGRREGVVLCTKFGHRADGTSDWAASSIEVSVLASAKRLGTDHLDIVSLHNPQPEILDGTQSEHHDVLEGLEQRGLIGAYGPSVDWSADIDTVLQNSASQALEVRMSALFQETWPGVERAHERGSGPSSRYRWSLAGSRVGTRPTRYSAGFVRAGRVRRSHYERGSSISSGCCFQRGSRCPRVRCAFCLRTRASPR